MSIRKPGSPTCWRVSPITRSTISPRCCPGTGASSGPTALPDHLGPSPPRPLADAYSFRCPAEFDRYRGIADSGKPAAQQVYEFTAPLPTTATAAVWPVFCVQPQVLPWSLRQALTSGDADMSNAQ